MKAIWMKAFITAVNIPAILIVGNLLFYLIKNQFVQEGMARQREGEAFWAPFIFFLVLFLFIIAPVIYFLFLESEKCTFKKLLIVGIPGLLGALALITVFVGMLGSGI